MIGSETTRSGLYRKEPKVNVTVPCEKTGIEEIDKQAIRYALTRAEYLRNAITFSMNSELFHLEMKQLHSAHLRRKKGKSPPKKP